MRRGLLVVAVAVAAIWGPREASAQNGDTGWGADWRPGHQRSLATPSRVPCLGREDGTAVPLGGTPQVRPSAAISRDTVIQRAKGWVGRVAYSMDPPHEDGWRRDCSGYVSYCWDVGKPGYGTATIGAVSHYLGSKDDLRSGDALLMLKSESHSDYGHVCLFDRWANADRTRYWAYDMHGPDGTPCDYHEIPYPYPWVDGVDPAYYRPIRFDGIIDDDPPPERPRITYPTADQHFYLGESIPIRWDRSSNDNGKFVYQAVVWRVAPPGDCAFRDPEPPQQGVDNRTWTPTATGDYDVAAEVWCCPDKHHFNGADAVRVHVDPAPGVGDGSSNPQKFIEEYSRHGGAGALGQPKGPVSSWGANVPEIQHFTKGSNEGSAIMWDRSTPEAHWVHGNVYVHYMHLDDGNHVNGPDGLGCAITDEIDIGPSPFGVYGLYQEFRLRDGATGAIFHNFGAGEHRDFHMYRRHWESYRSFGGPYSYLGWPTSNPYGNGTDQWCGFEKGWTTRDARPVLFRESPTAHTICAIIGGTQGDNGWYRSSVQVQLRPDIASVDRQWYINGHPTLGSPRYNHPLRGKSAWNPSDRSWVDHWGQVMAISTEGRNDFRYRSVVTAGAFAPDHVPEAWKGLTIPIDAGPPSPASLTFSPATQHRANREVTIRAVCTDSVSGVRRGRVAINRAADGSETQGWWYIELPDYRGDATCRWDTTGFEAGTHVVRLVSYDEAGNTQSDPAFTYELLDADDDPPSLSRITFSPRSPAIVGTRVQLAVTCSDTGTGVDRWQAAVRREDAPAGEADGGHWTQLPAVTGQTGTAEWDTTGLDPGEYHLHVYAWDKADNRAQSQCLRYSLVSGLASQPDGLISDGKGYLGNSIYNTSGVGQTHSKTASPGRPATYFVTFANDGNAPDVFRVTGTAETRGWSLRYLEHWTGADITSAVTGGGWSSPSLAPGGACRLKLIVSPRAGTRGGTGLQTAVAATSLSDRSRIDAVKAVTINAASRQPDGSIHDGTSYIGDGIYNTTGAGQTRTLTAATGRTATYYAKFENDGNVSERLRIKGTPTSDEWSVQYLEYWTGADITSSVARSGWLSQVLAPGESCRLKIIVSPQRGALAKVAFTALLSGASSGDAAKVDTVKAVTTCTPRYQPDGWIYNGTTYVGDDILNTTGADQSCSLETAVGRTVTYYPRFYNDGNGPERLRIVGTAGDTKWSVQYLEYWTNEDITPWVARAGWLTPVLQPGACARLKVLVTPGPSVAPGALLPVLAVATSSKDTARKDAVKATTTVK